MVPMVGRAIASREAGMVWEDEPCGVVRPRCCGPRQLLSMRSCTRLNLKLRMGR